MRCLVCLLLYNSLHFLQERVRIEPVSGKLLAIDVYHWDMISVLPVICAINLDVDLFVVKGMVLETRVIRVRESS